MDSNAVIATLTPLVTGASFEVGASVDFATVYVSADRLLETCIVLRDAPSLRFNVLVEVTAADYFPRAPRFEVVYHLLSIPRKERLRLKVRLAGGDASLESVTSVWPAADFFEREVFDLFGVRFEGHPDLRRILTDYGFIGHPFRKDFPISGHVEMRYDPEQKRVVYQPVSIEPREVTPRVVREAHYAEEK